MEIPAFQNKFVGVPSYLSTDLCRVPFDRGQLDSYACWRVSPVQGVLVKV